jgi:hypothetical protein
VPNPCMNVVDKPFRAMKLASSGLPGQYQTTGRPENYRICFAAMYRAPPCANIHCGAPGKFWIDTASEHPYFAAVCTGACGSVVARLMTNLANGVGKRKIDGSARVPSGKDEESLEDDSEEGTVTAVQANNPLLDGGMPSDADNKRQRLSMGKIVQKSPTAFLKYTEVGNTRPGVDRTKEENKMITEQTGFAHLLDNYMLATTDIEKAVCTKMIVAYLKREKEQTAKKPRATRKKKDKKDPNGVFKQTDDLILQLKKMKAKNDLEAGQDGDGQAREIQK